LLVAETDGAAAPDGAHDGNYFTCVDEEGKNQERSQARDEFAPFKFGESNRGPVRHETGHDDRGTDKYPREEPLHGPMNIKTRTSEQLFFLCQFSPSAKAEFASLIMSIMLVIGNRDLEVNAVSVRVRGAKET
jgi:hypothetical protein